MTETIERAAAKVPEVTVCFWTIKILATTLGETGGDSVSMSLGLGYLLSTIIFAAIFIAAVVAQIIAPKFHPITFTGPRSSPRRPSARPGRFRQSFARHRLYRGDRPAGTGGLLGSSLAWRGR